MKRIEEGFSYPLDLNLARRPAPIQPFARFGENVGVELYVKRDDLTGTELTGKSNYLTKVPSCFSSHSLRQIPLPYPTRLPLEPITR
jgi:hypothetical protein